MGIAAAALSSRRRTSWSQRICRRVSLVREPMGRFLKHDGLCAICTHNSIPGRDRQTFVDALSLLLLRPLPEGKQDVNRVPSPSGILLPGGPVLTGGHRDHPGAEIPTDHPFTLDTSNSRIRNPSAPFLSKCATRNALSFPASSSIRTSSPWLRVFRRNLSNHRTNPYTHADQNRKVRPTERVVN